MHLGGLGLGVMAVVFKKHGAGCKNNYNVLPCWADPKKSLRYDTVCGGVYSKRVNRNFG